MRKGFAKCHSGWSHSSPEGGGVYDCCMILFHTTITVVVLATIWNTIWKSHFPIYKILEILVAGKQENLNCAQQMTKNCIKNA